MPTPPVTSSTPPPAQPVEAFQRLHIRELVILGAVTIVAFWPLLTHLRGWLMDTRDIFDLLHPIDAFILGNMDRGEWPLWNSRILCGVPFLANPQTAFFYPPRFLGLLALGADWMNPVIALHGFLAGAFMLIRLRGLEFSRASSLIGALAYGFGGYVHACAVSGHLSMLWSMAWIPLIVHLQERSWSRARWSDSVACGFALGIQILGGQTQTTHYTIIIMAVGLLARAAEKRDFRFLIQAVLQFIAAGFVAGCVAAVQLAPMAEFGFMSDRSGASREFAAYFPIPPSSLFTLLFPVLSYREDALVVFDRGIIYGWESVFYPGVLTLFFACLGLMRWKARGYFCYVVIAASGLILALGEQTPLFRVLYNIIPGLGYFRISSRAVLLVLWAMVHLAALGMESSRAIVSESKSERIMRWGMIGVIALTFLAWIGSALTGTLATAAYGREEVLPLRLSDAQFYRPILVWVVALAFLIVPWRRYANFYRASAVVALAVDLLLARPEIRFLSSQTLQSAPAPPESVWQSGPDFQGPRRLDSVPSSAALLNIGMQTGMENVNGYWPLMPGRYLKLIEGLMGAPFPENQRTDIPDAFYQSVPHARYDLLNCTARYGMNPQTGELGLARFASALPRAWFVAEHRIIENEDAILTALLDPSFDPRKTVLIEQDLENHIEGPKSANASVTVTRNDEDEVDMEVRAPSAGWVVVSQNYFPGWRCRVGGEKSNVVRANYALMAFQVKPGEHKIELRYRPTSLIVGGLISLLSVIAAVGAVIVRLVRRRRALEATVESVE